VIASVVASVGLGGCFYVEPINQRPSLDIRRETADDPFRGDTLTLFAVADDPEDHLVHFGWRVYLCEDAARFETCDPEAAITGTENELAITVPHLRADPDGAGPMTAPAVESLRVVLEGRDDYGAIAKPTDVDTIGVRDRIPEVVLRAANDYGFLIGTPVELFAKYTDGDDALDALAVTWVVYSPSNVAINLEDRAVAQDPAEPAYRTAGKRFVPTATGSWKIEVRVTDPLGNEQLETMTVVVKEDRPPCVVQAQPIVPPVGQVLDVTEPTLFQINVDDDLDRWPLVAGDLLRQPPTFAWTVKAPGGARQPAGSGNSIAFDPAAFVPDSLVEVRVEIADRNATPLTCADADPTCSVVSTACIQRQTWKVRAR